MIKKKKMKSLVEYLKKGIYRWADNWKERKKLKERSDMQNKPWKNYWRQKYHARRLNRNDEGVWIRFFDSNCVDKGL